MVPCVMGDLYILGLAAHALPSEVALRLGIRSRPEPSMGNVATLLWTTWASEAILEPHVRNTWDLQKRKE
eukprot:7381867-Pyramimonas_sp.AAC.1